MTKNIVFCADGTWNGPGQPDQDDKSARATNVLKLFLNLAGQDAPDSYKLAKEQERTLCSADGTVLQASKYLHGVGDLDNFLAKALGGRSVPAWSPESCAATPSFRAIMCEATGSSSWVSAAAPTRRGRSPV